MNARGSGLLLAWTIVVLSACGKKGDPLPPLVRVPVAPGEFSGERRAAYADLQFTVPATNTDGSRPANITRVEIYGFSGASTVSDEELLKRGTRIASVAVKAPRDPDAVVDADEPDADLEPLEGTGLDQGISTHVREDLSRLASASSADPQVRYYIGVGITTRGRKGLLSKRVAVPLTAPPAAPAKPEVTYDERSVTLTWPPATSATGLTYLVYEIAAAPVDGKDPETRITSVPIAEPRLVDPRIEWDAQRCYAVTAVDLHDGLRSESEPSPQTCATFVDKFPPAPPAGLTPVASDASIELSWDPSAEADLAGYLVLRGTAPGDALTVITPAPIHETTYRDSVPPGNRYLYAVKAVDQTGNESAASARVEATAR